MFKERSIDDDKFVGRRKIETAEDKVFRGETFVR